ncbi:unknown [Clostridium sp. CAG:440]|nr:unknown [Clostridium sp. CAG:440]
MKFIFPQNYNFKNKILGIIDYTTLIFNIIWIALIVFLLNIIFNNLNIKIFFTIIFCFPIIILSLIGFNGENILYVFSYMFKYIFKQKLYLYNKH